MRLPLLAMAAVLVALAIGACGDTSKGPASSARTTAIASTSASGVGGMVGGKAPPGRHLGDEDDDDPGPSANAKNANDSDVDFDNDLADRSGKGYLDADDGSVLRFGHAASSADKRTITALVKRYYSAAAAADGGTACSLTFSIRAESLYEDLAQAAGPLYLRGLKTCPEILSRLFQHDHAWLTEPVSVTGVRVSGHRAYALLGWGGLPASEIELRTELGAWKIDDVLAVRLP